MVILIILWASMYEVIDEIHMKCYVFDPNTLRSSNTYDRNFNINKLLFNYSNIVHFTHIFVHKPAIILKVFFL